MNLRRIGLFVVLAGALPAQAQELHYGVKFGVTSITLIGDPEGPMGGEFNAGTFAAFPIRGALNALVSADYHRRASGSGLGFQHLSFLVAPQYYATLARSRVALYGFIGPHLNVSEDEDYNDVILGASAGVGFELTDSYVGPLLMELRYDADATPARSRAGAGPARIDQRLRRISLRLGFSL